MLRYIILPQAMTLLTACPKSKGGPSLASFTGGQAHKER